MTFHGTSESSPALWNLERGRAYYLRVRKTFG
jgi:hypothetical protein